GVSNIMSGRNLLSFLRYQSRFWSDENAFAQDGGTDRGLGSLAALAHYFADFTITPVSEPVAEGDKPAADKAPEATAEAIVFELATDEPAIVLHGASRFTLASPDSAVAAGGTLTIDASALGADMAARFDGSAETDGSFIFKGGAGNDIFTGGAKGDSFTGGLGADRLTGGAGADTFVYHSASESNGAAHDTLVGLNAAQDHIDLATAVTGVDAGVSGTLSAASFDSNLASALGASALGA